jgi:tetratricopeptide (TPR) repeat protein
MTGCSALFAPRHRGRLQRALASLELARLTGRPYALAETHREAARAYREAGALPSATTLMAQALRWSALLGAADAHADLLCEWVELLAEHSSALERSERGSGRPLREQARDAVFEAAQVAARVADPRWEVTVLLRLSDVLDRFGDRDDATLLQMRALQLTVGHRPEAGPPRLLDAQMAQRH